MTSPTRIARTVALATLLAIPATGVGAEVTVRVEGKDATILPPTRVAIPSPGLATITDTVGGDTRQVNAQTAAVAFSSALAQRSIPFGWSWSDFFQDINVSTIGNESPTCPNWPTDCSYFNLRVNGGSAGSGAVGVRLSDGMQIVFAFQRTDPVSGVDALDELDVSSPHRAQAIGQPFTVSVQRFAATASWSPGGPNPSGGPASGATVRYGSQEVTTSASGEASLVAEGSGLQDVRVSAPGTIRDSLQVCAYPATDPTVCSLPALPVSPDSTVSPTVVQVTTTIKTARGEVSVTANVPKPVAGQRPVAVRRSMITGADLTPAEMRKALGAVASAVAAQLNGEAGSGNVALQLPRGTKWQPAWLSGMPYVAPLRKDEALLGAASGGPANTQAMRGRAQGFQGHTARCDIDASARVVRRFGYAMTTLVPARERGAVIACATRQ